MQVWESGWVVRDHSSVGHESKGISLPRLLGRGRRRLDTGGGRGPSERQSMNAGRSLLGELVWRLWFNQRRGPTRPTKVCFDKARPGTPTPANQATPLNKLQARWRLAFTTSHWDPRPASIELSLWRPHPLRPLCPSQSFGKHRFLTIHSQPNLCSAAPQAGEPRLGPAHIVACILWPHRGKTQRGPVAQHLGYEGASGAEPWEGAPSTACHQN